jgi:hypothetical protein
MEYDSSFDKIEYIMQIIRYNKKESHMEIAEKFCIFKKAMKNDKLKQKYNI